MQAALESAHADLRVELQELMSAVGVQREDFEKRLATAEDRRAAAEAERDRLREELAASDAMRQREVDAAGERSRRELAELITAHDALNAELGALRDQLASAQVARDAAVGEAAGLLAELERLGGELAVAREDHAAHGGDLSEAQRLLAEARSLSAQLRSQSSQ
jgi:chromosome segregation ATPase